MNPEETLSPFLDGLSLVHIVRPGIMLLDAVF